jgi:hypothetical protein
MQVKFIKELSESELIQYKKSELWKKVASTHDFFLNSIEYKLEYFNSGHIDYSLIVFHEEVPLSVTYIYVNDKDLAYFNVPLRIFSINQDVNILNECYKNLFAKIHTLCQLLQIETILFEQDKYFIAAFHEKITSIKNNHLATIDLNLTNENIKSNIRKSFKSLANWGKRNMLIKVIDADSPFKDDFYLFKNFHILTSGKQTRSDKTWSIQYQAILNKHAYLVIGYIEKKIVGGAFIEHGEEDAYYGVGVYDRAMMKSNKPIAHHILLEAMFVAKNIGLKRFNLGKINYDDAGKLKNIALFKKGFSNTFELSTEYQANIK